MSIDKEIIKRLEDEAGNPIMDLNTSFITKTYSMSKMLQHLIILVWDNAGVTGTLSLEYFNGEDYIVYNNLPLDGTFSDAGWIDSAVGALGFRVKFFHTSGSANLTSFSANTKGDK